MPDAADFPQIEDSTQPDLAALKSNADWASIFGRGETNLAMRNKHASQVDDYNAALQQQHADALQQKLASDKDALNFWKATKDLEQKQAFHADLMQNEARRFQQKQQIDLANAKAKQKLDDLKADHAKLASDHLTNFTTAIQQGLMGGISPGTKEYQNLALNSLLANPLADKEAVKHVFEVAKIKEDPDEIIAQLNDLPPEQRVGATIHKNANGTYSWTAKNSTPMDAARLEGVQARTEATKSNMDVSQRREARMQSQFDRKLSDADAIKEDTSAFLADASRVHEQYEQGTPEYKQAMVELSAAYPSAKTDKIKPFLAMAGVTDSEAQALRVRAQDFREQMQLRNQARADTTLADKEKAAASKDTVEAQRLAQGERGITLREKQAQEANQFKSNAALTKEIEQMEKKRPVWRNTTGVFTDKKGVERFGKAELPWEESPVATPEAKAEYQRYQALVLKRAGITPKTFNPETGKIE